VTSKGILMGCLRNAFVVSATVLTIAVGASAVPGAAFAHGGGRGFHSRLARGGVGGGGLYVGHYDYGERGRGYGWGLDRVMAAAYNVSGSYLDGDYSVYPYGSW
jgi:hypothetical protein